MCDSLKHLRCGVVQIALGGELYLMNGSLSETAASAATAAPPRAPSTSLPDALKTLLWLDVIRFSSIYNPHQLQGGKVFQQSDRLAILWRMGAGYSHKLGTHQQRVRRE